jgi:hypothetical protein
MDTVAKSPDSGVAGAAPSTPTGSGVTAISTPGAAPSGKTAKFDVGSNCEYEGEVQEFEVAKMNSRETIDLLFKV